MKVAILGTAHVHVHAYVHHLSGHLHGVFDRDSARGKEIAERYSVPFYGDLDQLTSEVEAAVICSETVAHEELIESCVRNGVAILCEKPVAMDRESGARIHQLVKDHPFMTALPCRFAPAWGRITRRIQAGEIGEVLSISCTNHGKCPAGWFLDKSLGGGACLDHTVHCADLVNQLGLGKPTDAHAMVNSLFHHRDVEDAAVITYDMPGGQFVTIDASWSRPPAYPVWGDLTLNIVGTEGVVEADLFSQAIGLTQDQTKSSGYGSNLEKAMIQDFLSGPPFKTNLQDGLAADEWAWMALETV